MTLVIVLVVALIVALAAIVWLALEVRRLRSYAEYLVRQAERARASELAAEARVRDVGGRGEHGAPVVTPVDPISRTWSARRDPRDAIPTDRGS